MSQTLKDASDYLRLFLSTSKDQARLLLKSGTTNQINALCEIAYNLLTVSVPDKVKKLIKRCQKVFKKLGRKNISSKTKVRLILSKFTLFLSILLTLKPLILELLSS